MIAFKDPQKELQSAIDILDQVGHTIFSQRTQSIFKSIQNKLPTEKIKDAILKLRRHSTCILHDLESENPKKKEFAEKIIQSINHYNRSLNKPKGWKSKLALFCLPNLPQKIELHTFSKLLEGISYQTSQKVQTLFDPDISDLFKMKAISLLKQSHIHFVNDKRLKKCLEKPLHIIKQENNEIFVQQQLELIPDEQILISGKFKQCNSAFRSFIPLQESFQLEAKQTHTPFLTPYLFGGFLISPVLLPIYVKTPSLLIEETEKLFTELSPGKELNHKLKELYHLCSITYETSEKQFLDINVKIFNFLGKKIFSEVSLLTFSKAFRTANHKYILKPHLSLVSEWQSQKNKPLLNCDSDISLKEANKILKENIDHETSDPLIQCIGEAMLQPAHEIILNYHSEIIQFNPPKLSPLAVKLQNLALHQQMEFLKLMKAPLLSLPEFTNYLQDQLEYAYFVLSD